MNKEILASCLALLLQGCVAESASDDDDSSDSGTDADIDADTDVDSDTDTDTGTGTDTGSGTATATSDGITNVDPSGGSGGTIEPGSTGTTPLGAILYIPTSYDPDALASPAIWLFNEEISQWQAIADENGIILVDLDEYNDFDAIVAKLNESIPLIEEQYNVDRARYYWAGWSAGGNIVVVLGSENQDILAGTMVFPGTGGSYAQSAMEGRGDAHKIRLFYACGDQDANYSYGESVENEADYWTGFGYTTTFELVEGSGHYIDEGTYAIRAQAWDWIYAFNLQN